MFRLEGDVTHLEFGALSVKGQIANIFSLVGHMVPTPALQQKSRVTSDTGDLDTCSLLLVLFAQPYLHQINYPGRENYSWEEKRSSIFSSMPEVSRG